MNRIAEELDEVLRTLDPARAQYLEGVVRAGLDQVQQGMGWPPGYFEQTAGSLVGEQFERPPQGQLPRHADW